MIVLKLLVVKLQLFFVFISNEFNISIL